MIDTVPDSLAVDDHITLVGIANHYRATDCSRIVGRIVSVHHSDLIKCVSVGNSCNKD